MKKLLFGFMIALFVSGNVFAQADAVKLAKKAAKDLVTYNMDPGNNAKNLEEAKMQIEEALQNAEVQAMPSAWLTKGDIFNTITQNEFAKKTLDPKFKLTPGTALSAYNAYSKVNTLSDKKYEKKDALKGISEVLTNVINGGVSEYEGGNYGNAYNAFKAVLDGYELLKANKIANYLDEKLNFDNQVYMTGISALYNKDYAAAAPLLEQLYKAGTDNPSVYQGLYNCKNELKDEAGAKAVLTEGRKKFPNDSALLFDEINLYLKEGKLNDLTASLKSAIEKEPNNVGLYVTLGSVYDNLSTIEAEAKNSDKSLEYQGEALTYYQQALAKEPNNGDANYAMGAIYYNRAALITKEINALGENFNPANVSKMDKLEKDVKALFAQALPYFKKAESINANDTSTLGALKEIFARMDDLETANEMAKRLKIKQEGGKNEASFFKG